MARTNTAAMKRYAAKEAAAWFNAWRDDEGGAEHILGTCATLLHELESGATTDDVSGRLPWYSDDCWNESLALDAIGAYDLSMYRVEALRYVFECAFNVEVCRLAQAMCRSIMRNPALGVDAILTARGGK